MTVYVDKSGHLIADSLNELHAFAGCIGLRRDWFQSKRLPHYDLTTQRVFNRAMHAGAQVVTSREIVKLSRRLCDGRE